MLPFDTRRADYNILQAEFKGRVLNSSTVTLQSSLSNKTILTFAFASDKNLVFPEQVYPIFIMQT